MTDDSSTRSWEAAADDWIAHADISDYQNLFLQPRMFRLAGDVAGKRVLDLGCGEGAYSRALAGRGARSPASTAADAWSTPRGSARRGPDSTSATSAATPTTSKTSTTIRST